MYTKKDQWLIFWIVNAGFALFLVWCIVYLIIVDNSPEKQCASIVYFNTYCPGCGGTRAVRALLHFDIIGSFKFHPIVPITAFSVVAYEIALIKGLIKGEPRRCLIRPWMIIAYFGIWLGYSALRMVLLYYGIDLLGDIIV